VFNHTLSCLLLFILASYHPLTPIYNVTTLHLGELPHETWYDGRRAEKINSKKKPLKEKMK
jgi:hypothetical protein